jgi:uncharacterized membrane protein
MSIDTLEFASVFFSGLLAGEEFVIRFGVRGPLASLDPQAHIEMRQGLIRTLKVLVPILFAAALFSGIASSILHWDNAGRSLRLASVVLLLAFIILTLLGTVPINQAVGRWDAKNPPQGWRDSIRRWEALDSVRTALATGAFILALIGL